MSKTMYRTKESRESAIRCINGCIKAINEEEGLPYKMGTLTVEYIVQYLAEYKKLIERDLQKSN